MYKAVYTRKSKFNKDSISVESQIEFCKHEIKKGENSKEYSDNGFSGKDTNRKHFQKMIKDIEKGIIDKVIVYKLDRISRSIIDFANMMEFFAKYNVEFVSCSEKFDTSTPMGRAMLNICIVFAQLERETIQQRVTDAYHSRNKKGFYMGGTTPYGFNLEKTTIDNVSTSKYVVNKEEAEVVKMVYSMYAKQGVTIGDISKYLHSLNIKTRRGKPLGVMALSRILAQPCYVKSDIDVYNYYRSMGTEIINSADDFIGTNGCYLYFKKYDRSEIRGRTWGNDYDKKELVIAPHEGIVPSDLWIKCTTKRFEGSKKRLYMNQKGKRSWLVGKIKCAECGYAFCIYMNFNLEQQGIDPWKRRQFYCSGRNSHHCCTQAMRPRADEIEKRVFSLMKDKLDEFKQIHGNQQLISDPKINEYKIKLSKIESKISDLLSKVLGSNKILMDYINNQVEQLDMERKEMQEQILLLSNVTGENDIDKIQNYIETWDETKIQDKIFVADSIIEKILIKEGQLNIQWKI